MFWATCSCHVLLTLPSSVRAAIKMGANMFSAIRSGLKRTRSSPVHIGGGSWVLMETSGLTWQPMLNE